MDKGADAMQTWKVGALARQAGLTVRTLHHYDEIGLLSPSHRTGAGHRLYTAEDLGRLLQILSLRQLGLSLDDIRESLARPESSLQRVLALHIAQLRERIDSQQRLCRRLETVAGRLHAAETVSVDEFIAALEAMTMFEKHFTPEQLQDIHARGEQTGPERIHEVEAEWPRLIAEVRAAMESGADPESAAVQKLAERWTGLLREFTGGNPGIQKGLNAMYSEEPEVRSRTGIDPAVMGYIGKAVAAAKKQS
jgi:DNA-binding transcriptional MerR regulator